jgi:hypothetical protein
MYVLKKIFTVLFILVSLPLCSEEIYIAPLLIFNDSDQFDTSEIDVNQLLFIEKMVSIYRWENMSFKPIPMNAHAPGSFLDAMELCNEFQIDFLVYGFIEYREVYIHGEIKLYNREKREVIKAFYASDDTSNLERLLLDLAEKFGNYLNALFDLTPEEEAPPPTGGIFSFGISGGYFLYLIQDWTDYLLPLYSVQLQANFIPIKPAEGKGFRGFYFKTGITTNFTHAVNRLGYEEIHFLGFAFGLYLGLMADIGIHHTLGIVVTPEYYIDYLIRNARYDDQVLIPAHLFSTSLSLNYQFHFNRMFSMSLENRFSLQFVDPMRITYNPCMVFEFSLNPMFGGRSDEEK